MSVVGCFQAVGMYALSLTWFGKTTDMEVRTQLLECKLNAVINER